MDESDSYASTSSYGPYVYSYASGPTLVTSCGTCSRAFFSVQHGTD
jgi:hypothetical protein